MSKIIKVVVVDDSALMRQMLTEMLSSDPEIEVVSSAPDPLVAREQIKRHDPDVVTLDIEMPKMDGLSFLEKIMTLRPTPVVMVSSLTQAGADATIRALELGAVDCFGKPQIDLKAGLQEASAELIAKVKTAARARVKAYNPSSRPATVAGAGLSFGTTEKIIAIGASTGGVEALTEIITQLPPDSPAVLVAQHMPVRFTSSLADRLDGKSHVAVATAQDGERVLPGHVYIAPGPDHLELSRSGANYVCRYSGAPPVSGHRPSVDVLFNSVAQAAGANAVGLILTGMGSDGAQGLLRMRESGARTFGQDEATCVVYGMPRAAKAEGAVETELPLSALTEAILRSCGDPAERKVRV